jgi:quercetin dioxygenase-like cupin family protein
MARVVTGWDDDGAPTILFEGAPPVEIDDRLMRVAEIWATDSTPPPTDGRIDIAARDWRFEPAPNGSIFRVVTFLPGATSGMHSTETIDYLVVVDGEIVLVVGERELTVRAGDVVVQNATPHNWINRSGRPCVMAGILLSTQAPD